MLTRFLIIFSLLALASACDDTASRLAHEAEVCKKAVEIGELELAEKHCQLALGAADDDVLSPQVKSDRLYKLATIKRQRGNYAESSELLIESLALEKNFSGPDSPQVASRRLEMALNLAALGQWLEGARLLEQIVPLDDRLNEKDQFSLRNTLRFYIRRLQKMDQPEQLSRLQTAAAGLEPKKKRSFYDSEQP